MYQGNVLDGDTLRVEERHFLGRIASRNSVAPLFLSTPSVNDSEHPPPDGACPQPKLRLLLVEDEPSLRQLLAELLRADYELLVAPDGERAWEMVMQTPAPDLVLSDVEMPGGVCGIELTRRLRTLARTAMVPILLFSANNRLPKLLEGLEVGADDYLLKPFRPPELFARLRSRYRLCEMRREIIARQNMGG